MNDSHILKNIRRHIELSNSARKHLLSVLIVKSAQKKELVLKQGQMGKKLFFVESGSLRAFNVNSGGRESTIMFAIQDW